MKKILAIGFVFLVSACTRCGDCCYSGCSAPVQNTCCNQVQVVREPVQRQVYRTVYEPRNYDKTACERKAYKTRDCTADSYYERPQVVKQRPVVVYQQKNYNMRNNCASSCCGGCQASAPEPRKMTCECSMR